MIFPSESQYTEFKTSFNDKVSVALVANANEKILPNRMEFYNSGVLPLDLTIEKLMSNEYSSRQRNKQIADIFKDTGDIEKYGSGIKRVCRMFEEAGLEKPVWNVVTDGIMVTVFLHTNKNVPENAIENNKPKQWFTSIINENEEADIQTLQNDGVRLNDMQKIAMDLLYSNPQITAKELANVLQIKIRLVERIMDSLKAKGLITRIGSDKDGYWKVVEMSHKNE